MSNVFDVKAYKAKARSMNFSRFVSECKISGGILTLPNGKKIKVREGTHKGRIRMLQRKLYNRYYTS